MNAAILHVEAATLLVLRDEHHEAAHTLLSAARRVLWDLSTERPSELIEKLKNAVVKLVKPGHEKEWIKYQNRAANFFKHADRDPDEILSGIDLPAVNQAELLLLTMVIGEYNCRLSHRLTIALCYCGFKEPGWFDFRAYVSKSDASEMEFDYYQNMSDQKRTELLLLAYDRFGHDN